jgi:ribosomal protein S18 acetylase RimI-like enzyme
MIDKEDVFIVQGEHEHIDLLAPLFDAYRVFYEQPSDIEGASKYLSKRMSNQESVIFLALRTGQQQALGFTQLYPSFTSVRLGRIWILYDLYVNPEVRRQGIGRRLMVRAQQFALASGALGLELSTARDNKAAQALYESLGYVRDEDFYYYELAL